jgi:hypothetical protein
MKSIRILTAIAAFAAIGAQAQQLYLGDGATIGNINPLTWDTNSANWATDDGATNWVTWSDGNDAYLPGDTAAALEVYLETDLDVTVNDLVYDWSLGGNGGINIYGTTNGTETLTINGTLYTKASSRQFTFREMDLGGTFTVSNITQFVLNADTTIAPGTHITTQKRISLSTDLVDYSNLSVTLDGGELRASGGTNKVVNSVAGTGSFTSDTDLQINNITVGTVGTIATNDVTEALSLTLGSGTHKFDVNNSAGVLSNDRLYGANIEAGGTLEISTAPGSDTLAVSNVFGLFAEDAGVSGDFSSITLPALGGGLTWGTNQLLVAGWIYVTDGIFEPELPTPYVPVANPDAYEMTVPAQTILVVDAATGVLANDTVEGLASMSALLETDAASGTLNLYADGSFDYTPDSLVAGVDSFTYRAITSQATSSVATVTITINETAPELTLRHYTFDSDLTDSSGNAQDGTYSGSGASITNASKFGAGSLNTAGTGYVTIPTESFLTTDNWSLSLWYNATSTNANALAGQNGALNSTFRYNSDQGAERNYRLRTGNSSDAATYTATQAPTAIDTGVWHHLVVSTTGIGNDLKFYEDGVEIPGWASDDDTAFTINTIGEGGRHATLEGVFNGLIDEVWVMNYALSSNQVAELYNNNGGGDGPVTNAAATIVSSELASSNTLKVVVSLEAGSVASEYSPKAKTDLVNGATWDPVAHSATFDGAFAVTNLDVATDEGGNYAIYVKSTNTAEFIRIEADLVQ